MSDTQGRRAHREIRVLFSHGKKDKMLPRGWKPKQVLTADSRVQGLFVCLSVKTPDILYITSRPEILHIQTVLRACGAAGSMLTVCSYVFHREVVNMRHVADSGEDHKASQDARQWVGDCYNQSIPGKKGERFPARFKKLKTPETPRSTNCQFVRERNPTQWK